MNGFPPAILFRRGLQAIWEIFIRVFKFYQTISKFNLSTEIILFIRIINQQFLQTFIVVLEMGKYNIRFIGQKGTLCEFKTVEFQEGENAFISFCRLVKTYPDFKTPVVKLYHEMGAFIQEMFGLKGTAQIYWGFYVNDHYSPVGIEAYILKNGDKIEWKYGPNIQKNLINIEKIMD